MEHAVCVWQPRYKAANVFTLGMLASCIALSIADLILRKSAASTAAPERVSAAVQTSMAKSADSLWGRAFKASPMHSGPLDSVTVGKAGQLAAASRRPLTGPAALLPNTGHRSLMPSRAHAQVVAASALRAHQRQVWTRKVAPRIRYSVRTAALGAPPPGTGFGLDPDVEKRMADGTIVFDDYILALEAMQRMRRFQQGGGAELPGAAPESIFTDEEVVVDPELDAIDDKIRRFKKVIDAMSAEERATPDIFIDPSLGTDVPLAERVTRVAKASGEDDEVVGRLVFEFQSMREMEFRLARGEKYEDIQRDMMSEAAPEDAAPAANRAQKRAQKKKPKADKSTSSKGFR